ncbi:fungal-specific transcription factor domain-containing protein [Lasiosphaeria ovina]|uniref:Fungal-specific transcription factor domain-containing protein n=1 Tax=Lasiosphaeria ovina TaxID=92902 RepID=A0AAE0K443_9PEZI|nr:fungal-specific transcription factor domain-containing protein [Lasiosphaeria ovina]
MPRTRQGDALSCWTCRLRRKRCDAVRPVCRSCAALDITCYAGTAKPDWMDGATMQRAMAQEIKAQIKQGAAGRRERRQLDETRDPSRAFIITSQQDYSLRNEPARPRVEAAGPSPDPTPLSTPSDSGVVSMSPYALEEAAVSASEPHPRPTSTLDRLEKYQYLNGTSKDLEADCIYMYLENDFPYLFPFYRAPRTGHSKAPAWLLAFLRQNEAVFHSVLAFSSYFFTVALNDVFPGAAYAGCKFTAWGQVAREADKCFATIQRDLQDLARRGADVTLVEQARVMESIMQLLIFDMFVGASQQWELHLNPATTLLADIFAQHGCADSDAFSRLLHEMAPAGYPTPDQEAFRFFTAVLLFTDTIASTALRQPPRLHALHPLILSPDATTTESQSPRLDLSAFVGCPNWALQAISATAVLAAEKRASRLSAQDLAARAAPIADMIDAGLARLDAADAAQPPPPSELHARHVRRLMPFYRDVPAHTTVPTTAPPPATSPSPMLSTTTPARVWAHATRIYLATITSSSPHPNNNNSNNSNDNEQIRTGVHRVLSLLLLAGRGTSDINATINSVDVASALHPPPRFWCAAQLRTLAWPICVAGCCAREAGGERAAFRAVIAGAGDLHTYSGLRGAGRVLDAVWDRDRDDGDGDGGWDLADCLGILGTPALLV